MFGRNSRPAHMFTISARALKTDIVSRCILSCMGNYYSQLAWVFTIHLDYRITDAKPFCSKPANLL